LRRLHTRTNTSRRLKQTELLTSGTKDLVLLDLHHVEADGLGQRAALSDGHDITFLNIEARGAVSVEDGVTLLETLVLLDQMQVATMDNDGVFHLGGDAHTLDDFTTDGNISSKWAFLVKIFTVFGFFWGLERQTNVSPVTIDFGVLFTQDTFVSYKDCRMFLAQEFFRTKTWRTKQNAPSKNNLQSL
jgi:hypothetical protein